MNNSLFIFKLNNNEQIMIQVDEYPDDVPYCFYDADFYLKHDKIKNKLCHYSLISYVDEFAEALQGSLDNQRRLSCDFTANIGYLWNQYVNADNDNELACVAKDCEFLEDYYIWYSTFTAWLYNDSQGNIILEITPSYPDTYSADFSYEDFLKWMEDYKPLLKVIVSREVAEQWLDQATQILAMIDENTQQFHAQGKL